MRHLGHMMGIAAALATAMFVTNAEAKKADAVKTTTVDCSLPNSTLQAAINSASPNTVIFIRNTCTENPTIRTDDITLDGDPDAVGNQGGSGVIDGTVTVDGAARVNLQNLTVAPSGAGDRNAIDIVNNAFARISNSEVHALGVFGQGLSAERGAIAILDNSLVTAQGNNSVDDSCALNANVGGIIISEGGNTLENFVTGGMTGDTAICSNNGGHFRKNSGTPIDTIRARFPVSVANNAEADVRGVEIDNPGGPGNTVGRFIVFWNSSLRIRNSDLTGSTVEAEVQSFCQLSDDLENVGAVSEDATSVCPVPPLGF